MRFLITFLLLIFTGQLPADHNALNERTLVVGSEPDFPPFSLGDTEQTARGFTVELWKAVAAESHINYTLRVRPFNQLLTEFKSGKIDVLINVAQSAERHRYADFTVPTAIVNGAIFVRKQEESIHSEANLAGKSVIVIHGDLAEDYAISRGWQKQLVLVQNAAEGLKLLSAGKYDAMLLSKLVGLQTLAQFKIANVRPLMTSAGFVQKFSFAVHAGDSDLLAHMNEGLALIKSSGIYDRIYDKWFGVYEQKQIFERVLLNFIGPFFLVLAIFFGVIYFKWRAIRRASQQQIDIYQNRIQLALEGGDLGLWDWEILSGRLFVNERWKAMLGMHPNDTVSHISHWETRVHPNDWQTMNPILEGYLQGTIKIFESEYRLLHEDGRWIWVLDRGKVVERGPDGSPIRMVGTHLDISDRKQKQLVLESLLAEQNVMLENELIGIAKIKNGCFTWTSRSFGKIMNYGRNELIGKPASHLFISQEAYQTFSNDCYSVLNDNKPFRTEVLQICKDGRQIWADLSCNIIDPQNNEVMVIISDVTEQKLAEDAKQEALNRLDFIAGQVPGFIYQFRLNADGSSCLPYVSQGFIKVCGLAPEAVREDSTKVFALVHPDDYQDFINSILISADHLTPWHHEFRLRLADGTIRWLLGNSKPTELKDNVIIWFGFVVDISERREMEATLVQTEARYERIITCSDLASWDCDLQTGLVVHNEIWTQKFGYESTEIEHFRDWENLIHPDNFPAFRAVIEAFLKSSSGFFHIEYRVKTKPGQWLWISDRGSVIEYDNQGRPKRMAGTQVDVTARKVAEQELKLNQERLFFALQGANDGMWEWNYETDEVYFSPRWKSMLGYADNELVNEIDTWAKLVDPADREAVYQKAKHHVEGKLSKFEVEFRMRHKDGHWVDILSRARLAIDENGEKILPLRMIGTHVDISERKYLEEQRIIQEIEHRNTLIREVHHRIKNNIQGITGILRQFAQAYPETVNPINQAISQMKSLAIVYGLQGLDSMSSVKLSELLNSIVKNIESIWGVTISVDLLPDKVECTIAENEVVPLALVINELIFNAIKHAGQPDQVNVILTADLTHKRVKILIKNTGQLPVGFDFINRRHLNTGLELVTSLLPNKGAILSFEQQDSTVATLLEYQSPLIDLATH